MIWKPLHFIYIFHNIPAFSSTGVVAWHYKQSLRSELELDSRCLNVLLTRNVDGFTWMMSFVSGSVMTLSSSGASSPGRRLNMETSRRDSRVIIPLSTSRGSRTRTDSQLKQSWIVAPAKALWSVTIINWGQSASLSSTLTNCWLIWFSDLMSFRRVWCDEQFVWLSVCILQKING